MSSPMAGVAMVNAIVFGVYGQTQKHIANSDHLSSHFIAGALAGIAQSPICGPIELAKTRMQLQELGTRFSGPIHCLKHTYQHEGYRGVFKGLGVTFLREMPSFGVYFLTYEAMTRMSGNDPISTPYMLLAGGLAGTASWVISYPLDVVKSRIQADSNRYAGMFDCLKQSVRTEGYMCLYRGLNSTILRAFPTNAVTFTVVTWTFRLLGQEEGEVSKADCKPELEKSIKQISDGEPFLREWNSLLTNASDSLMILRSGYSTLSMTSTSELTLRNSVLSQTDKWTNVRIKCDVDEEGSGDCHENGNEKLEAIKVDVDQSVRNSEVEWAGIEQTVAKYSFDDSLIVSASDLVSCT